MSNLHHGSCLCGAVKYRTEGPLRPVVACHCQQCRKTSGHYGAATSVAREGLTIAGDVKWFVSSETARRGFCPTCGSSLLWDGGGANVSIWAGTLDGETGLALRGHIFADDKGDYYSISDPLPVFPQDDDEMTSK